MSARTENGPPLVEELDDDELELDEEEEEDDEVPPDELEPDELDEAVATMPPEDAPPEDESDAPPPHAPRTASISNATAAMNDRLANCLHMMPPGTNQQARMTPAALIAAKPAPLVRDA